MPVRSFDMRTAAQRAQPLALPRRVSERVFNMVTPLLDQHVQEGRGTWPAVITDDGELTYAALQEQTNRMGNVLLDRGVQPEQRVALLLPDGPEFVAGFLAAMKIGAVPVPLNTAAHRDDLQYFLENSRARVLITTPDLGAPLLEDGWPANLPRLARLLVAGGRSCADERVEPLEAAVRSASAELAAFPTGVDEPCYWLYSSGTTGRPKGTVHLHGDMVACVAPYAQDVVALTPGDRTFSVARLFFSYGLVNSLFLPLLGGAAAILTPHRVDPAEIGRIMRSHRPTVFFSVPTSYVQVCAALEQGTLGETPFASVRLAVSAGEPLPAPLYERWKRLTGVEALDGIGSTEVGYIYCSNRPGAVRPGSSGLPIGEHVMQVMDEEGRPLPAGTPGELWVQAASTALHYWNQREKTKTTFVGPWLRTGDRYEMDPDGYFWYLGRQDDVFKVSGQWVSPAEVESCLMEHTAVSEAAVIGRADAEGLVKTVAYVVLRPNAAVTAEELQAHVKGRLLPHKYPRQVLFVDALPKTASGKVQRFKLREGAPPTA